MIHLTSLLTILSLICLSTAKPLSYDAGIVLPRSALLDYTLLHPNLRVRSPESQDDAEAEAESGLEARSPTPARSGKSQERDFCDISHGNDDCANPKTNCLFLTIGVAPFPMKPPSIYVCCVPTHANKGIC